MNALFQAIYEHYAAFRNPADAYALTGGRLYRGQAPEGAGFPYIVMILISGTDQRMFTDDVEDARIQFSVFGEFGGDARPTMAIYESLHKIFQDAILAYADGSLHVRVRREGFPREVIEDEVVHISADYMIERQVSI